MTPDMKRLCEAASGVFLDMRLDYLELHEAEKVVRAVLTALREPSGETERYAAGEWSRRNVEAMVDDILCEPATA